MKAAAPFAIAVALASASSAQAQGKQSPPENWRQLVEQHLATHLRDPYSAVKRVVRDHRFGHLPSYWKSKPGGWLVCYSVNARNGYGGYTGAETYVFQLDETGVVDQLHGGSEQQEIEAECAQPAWRPENGTSTSANPKIPL